MKYLSESNALLRMEKVKNAYRDEIREKYEPKAKSCITCEVQGSCCIDEHFVNVHITRLEAAAIRQHLETLEEAKKNEIYARIDATIEKYKLSDLKDTFLQTFACPLFEKGTGCLVHPVKPVPCIQHACYERREDLPPDELQAGAEARIERLNVQTYRQNTPWLPIPLQLKSRDK